jgi:ABC-type glycerol-3-phosphate transport system substrate-binding protein
MKIKPFTCFLFAVAIILIALSPWLIQSYYSEAPATVPYKGILTLWNITGWRTGGSSCGSFLKKRIADFEARNASIFIDFIDLTAAEADAALQKGEVPDIVSYPLGLDIDLPLSQLPHKYTIFPEINENAYPYMCGAYCLLINADMLEENGLFAPVGWGVRPDELLSMSGLGVCFDSEEGCLSLPAVALHEYPETEGPKLHTWGEPRAPDAATGLTVVAYSDGLNCFFSGKAGLLIASQRQLFEVNAKLEEGEAPAYLAYALSNYTDMAQLVSAVWSDDDKKRQACVDFAGFLIEERVQAKLEALGVFPVLPGLEIYADNDCMASIYKLLSEGAVLALPEDRPMLSDLSIKALGGNNDALAKLKAYARR